MQGPIPPLIGAFDLISRRLIAAGPTVVAAPANKNRYGLVFNFNGLGGIGTPLCTFSLADPTLGAAQITLGNAVSVQVLTFPFWGPWVTVEWRLTAMSAGTSVNIFETIWIPQRLGEK